MTPTAAAPTMNPIANHILSLLLSAVTHHTTSGLSIGLLSLTMGNITHAHMPLSPSSVMWNWLRVVMRCGRDGHRRLRKK